jgi:hypothetical protein
MVTSPKAKMLSERMSNIKTYIASVFFKSEYLPEKTEQESIWEESLYLVHSDSKENAELQISQAAMKAECSYVNSESTTVTVKFEKIERIVECEINNNLNEPIEVFSRYLKASEAVSILYSKFE